MARTRPYIAVYMMANRRNGTLYTGVTSDLSKRVFEHQEGLLDGFTKQHGCKLLVWYEPHDEMTVAIQREKNIKHWIRRWKIELVEAMNPEWRDLYQDFNR